MKLTLEPTGPPGPHRHLKVTVETNHDDHTIDEVIDNVVVPALLAWGFTQKTIDNYLDDETD
jgi:hypothetical protein